MKRSSARAPGEARWALWRRCARISARAASQHRYKAPSLSLSAATFSLRSQSCSWQGVRQRGPVALVRAQHAGRQTHPIAASCELRH